MDGFRQLAEHTPLTEVSAAVALDRASNSAKLRDRVGTCLFGASLLTGLVGGSYGWPAYVAAFALAFVAVYLFCSAWALRESRYELYPARPSELESTEQLLRPYPELAGYFEAWQTGGKIYRRDLDMLVRVALRANESGGPP
jgi:hypothetical protein